MTTSVWVMFSVTWMTVWNYSYHFPDKSVTMDQSILQFFFDSRVIFLSFFAHSEDRISITNIFIKCVHFTLIQIFAIITSHTLRHTRNLKRKKNKQFDLWQCVILTIHMIRCSLFENNDNHHLEACSQSNFDSSSYLNIFLSPIWDLIKKCSNWNWKQHFFN